MPIQVCIETPNTVRLILQSIIVEGTAYRNRASYGAVSEAVNVGEKNGIAKVTAVPFLCLFCFRVSVFPPHGVN